MITTTVWTYSFNTAIDLINLVLPKRILLRKKQAVLEILKAIYGIESKEVDVTTILRNMLLNNSLTVTASNQLAGDPNPGIVKKLSIIYKYGNKEQQTEITEGEQVTLPILNQS
jgi:Domain of unknown function (DUF3395)